MKIQLPIPCLVRLSLAASVCLAGFAAAQEEEAARRPDRILRVLPLGDGPPWEEENVGGKDGRRVEKEAPPGSRPPFRLCQMTPDGDELGDTLRLSLGRVSPGLPVTGGTVRLFEVDNLGVNAKPWHELKIPANATHSLAVLVRDAKTKDWTAAQGIVLNESPQAFPPGALRFVNVTGYPVEFTVMGQKVPLARYKHITSSPQRPVTKAPLIVELIANGQRWKIADQDIVQGEGDRTTIFVYLSDGVQIRTPAKVKVISENPKALPRLPRPN